MSRAGTAIVIAAIMGAAMGCNAGPHAATGFRLPAYGDVERGKAAFVSLDCNRCHRVTGVELPQPPDAGILVVLGGDTQRQMTDGYLVTSIINPSHVVARYPKERMTTAPGKSKMPDYADISVRQMTDLVTFLQANYKLRPPAREYVASY
jgi:hypothetical protein